MDVTLELGRLNVIVGPNGSGKTNLLEAIGLLGSAASGRVDYDTLRARGVRLGTPVLYKSALRAQKRLLRTIELAAESDSASYRVGLGNPVERGTISWKYASEALVEGDRELGARSARKGNFLDPQQTGPREVRQRIAPEEGSGLAPLIRSIHGGGALARLLRQLDGYAIYAPSTPFLSAALSEPYCKPPLGLQGGGLAECALSVRQHPEVWRRVKEESFALMDWAVDARLNASSDWRALRGAPHPSNVTLSLRDRYLRSETSWVSAREADDGMLFVLFLFMLLLHPAAPPLLAIDNVDRFLHPELAGRLVGRIEQIVLSEPERPQLLLTAQSPAVLDALERGDERVRRFAVQRDSRGATAVGPWSRPL